MQRIAREWSILRTGLELKNCYSATTPQQILELELERRACRADLAAAAFVAFRLVSMRLLRALCFPSIVIGLTINNVL